MLKTFEPKDTRPQSMPPDYFIMNGCLWDLSWLIDVVVLVVVVKFAIVFFMKMFSGTARRKAKRRKRTCAV